MTKIPTKQTQIDLETVFSKHQLLDVLREQFSEIGDEFETKEEQSFVCDALSQIYLHRQADPVTLVGILSPKHGEPQEVADKLLALAEADKIDYDENRQRFIVKYDIPVEVQDMLDRYQYPLPMIRHPEHVGKNTDTGYHTIKGNVVLNGSPYFNDKDLCLDHLNRANSVALCFDSKVLDSQEGKFKKPKRKHGEGFADFEKRLKQASVFYSTSLTVMESLSVLSDEFYLTHKYDRRGRCYASGYHVNTQGTDYNKAVLQMSKKEVVMS